MKFFLIIFSFLLIFLKSNANDSIAFIDLDFIAKNSLLGKSVSTQVKKKRAILNDEISKHEKQLKEKEKKIISQKNILDQDQFKIKIDELRNMIKEYQIIREKKNKQLSIFSQKANKQVLNLISPILNEYSKKNSISIIFQKKNIVTGRSDLDITSDILKQLNDKIKKIDLSKIK
ncbi:OmpH family outer membrane protein [Candidatus Pelagibacter sp.]|nr:OmpH family outer membrane protein [Candidatus Pelagibacter sp.]|tara:strand:+ start:101 stop:625 length:525 start_codon:yes stop_codon:yes gene_type:complete